MVTSGQNDVTVPDLLWQRAVTMPTRRAYVFLDDRGTEQETRTYCELANRAHAIARVLRDHARVGDRAALTFNPGMLFLDAFFGCLYAGLIPVPMVPPHPRRERRLTVAILRDSAPSLVLTTKKLMTQIRDSLADTGADSIPLCLAIDEIDESTAQNGDNAPIFRATAGDIAFLQYTSGSTATPKGVMVSHGNLVANARMIAAAMRQDETSTFVGWTPLHHDQGLIGNVLQPLHLGAMAVLMAPNAFLQRPHVWLEAIHCYRAHTSGGPDFAYGILAERIQTAQHPDLDLSCWRVAFDGAEPLRPSVLDQVAAALAPLGFRPDALYPCYGLAEATLFVTGSGEGVVTRHFDRSTLEQGQLQSAPGGVRLASSGRPGAGVTLTMVNPDTRAPCPDGIIGEIWIAGPSIALGYWQRAEETKETFAAVTADGSGPFLRTGDLGCMVDGEMYVCGRRKDMIIIRGRNLYAQDIEATVRSAHPAVRYGSAAVVEVFLEGDCKLLVAVEIHRTERHSVREDDISAAIRRAVREEHDVSVDRLVVLLPGGIPKTSSGKVRRSAVGQAFLAGDLPLWLGPG